MTLLQKNHKPIDPITGLPKTRPVCEASSTFNQRANGYLVAILGGAIKSDPTCESISTEDHISKVDAFNKKIVNGDICPNKLMVGSLDVTSLYTSISTKVAGVICKDRILNSKVSFEGVDYTWAVIYLKLTMSPSEIVDSKMQSLLPRKKSKQGSNPTILTGSEKENQNRWWHPKPPKLFTLEDKRKIVACITQQLVKVVFGSHYYVFNNQIYKQEEGCPMGLESSCPVSRVVMDFWASEIRKTEEKMEALATINTIQFESI